MTLMEAQKRKRARRHNENAIIWLRKIFKASPIDTIQVNRCISLFNHKRLSRKQWKTLKDMWAENKLRGDWIVGINLGATFFRDGRADV